MKKLKKVEFAIVAAVLLLAVLLGCIQPSFEQEYADLKVIEAKYNLGEAIVPGSLKELQAYKLDLLSLKATTGAKQKSSADDALLQLIAIKLDIVDIETALIIARQEIAFTDFARPSCKPGTHLGNAVEGYDIAMTQSGLAKQKIEIFKKSFGQEARNAGLALDSLEKSVEIIGSQAKEFKEAAKYYCISG